MDQGYKHFSHLHNLIMHHMPEGTKVSCSGCHTSATRTIFVCWQCNFFLHDQCYRATRSLKHPSHPPHFLTLVPYPTYPSNSFYCNSCRIKGTGFSYSCADCEFDLHVQCAYSFSGPTSWTGIHNSNMTNSVPYVYDHAYVNSIPPGHQNSIPAAQNSPMAHFSHPHNLSMVNLKPDKTNEVICSGCKDTLVGKGYSCFQLNCDFHLHESCFHLKTEIHHKSHPEHPLKLLPYAPYNNKNGEFTCNACFGNGTGFTYNCLICNFDLHIQCVSLPETVKRADHEHTLKLFYLCPVKSEGYTVSCDVCHGSVEKDRWAYYCESCNYDTHLGCVNHEKRERDSEIDTQVQLQRLQLEMQMNQQLAQMIAGMGASISSLAP